MHSILNKLHLHIRIYLSRFVTYIGFELLHVDWSGCSPHPFAWLQSLTHQRRFLDIPSIIWKQMRHSFCKNILWNGLQKFTFIWYRRVMTLTCLTQVFQPLLYARDTLSSNYIIQIKEYISKLLPFYDEFCDNNEALTI